VVAARERLVHHPLQTIRKDGQHLEGGLRCRVGSVPRFTRRAEVLARRGEGLLLDERRQSRDRRSRGEERRGRKVQLLGFERGPREEAPARGADGRTLALVSERVGRRGLLGGLKGSGLAGPSRLSPCLAEGAGAVDFSAGSGVDIDGVRFRC
jgi:hypothetical protein